MVFLAVFTKINWYTLPPAAGCS